MTYYLLNSIRVAGLILAGVPAGVVLASGFQEARKDVTALEIPRSLSLVPGTTRIYVPAGEEWRAVGLWMKDQLAGKGCGKIEVVEAGSAVTEHGLVLAPGAAEVLERNPACAILVGNLGNNALIRLLYVHWRTCLDADYLADDGWAVQGVARGWEAGGNAVMVQAMSPAAARMAGARLVELAVPATQPPFWQRLSQKLGMAGQELAVPIIFEFHPAASRAKLLARFTQEIDSLEKQFVALFDRKSPEFRGIHGRANINYYMTGAMQTLGNLGVWWSVTADPRCPDLARKLLAQVQAALGEFKGEASEMNDLDYSLEPMVRGIHLLIGHPALLPEDRHAVLSLMALFAQVAHPGQIASEAEWKNQTQRRPVISSRHPNAMAAGTYHLGRLLNHWAVLQGHTRDVVADMIRSSNFYLDTISDSYGDLFDHVWTFDSVSLIQQYALERPKPAFVSRDQLRLGADYMAMMLRPTGDFVIWGGESLSPDERFWAWPVLGRAETLLGGGEYQWLHDRHLSPGAWAKTFIYGNPNGIHVYNPGHPPVEPDRLAGLCVAPTNPMIDEDVRDGATPLWNGLAPRGPPPERRFLKLSCRAGWSNDAQYFAVNGIGGYHYGTSGMAAFLSYDQFGVQLIASLQPRYSERYQNAVFINRARLKNRLVPFEASVESLNETADGGYARLRLENANGANWTRHLFWEKNRHLLVWDEVEADVDDDYYLTCGWRSPIVTAALDAGARTLTATQSNVVFRIVNVDLGGQPACRMVARGELPSVFPFTSERRMTTLSEQVHVPLTRGQKYHFINLLHAANDPASPPPQVKALNELTVQVKLPDGERCYSLRGANGWIQAGNVRLSAAAAATGPAGWKAYDLTEVAVAPDRTAPAVKASAPVHLESRGGILAASSCAWKLNPVRVSSEHVSVGNPSGANQASLGSAKIRIDSDRPPSQLTFTENRVKSSPLPTAKIPAFKGLRFGPTLASFPTLPDGTGAIDKLAVGEAGERNFIAVGLHEKSLRVIDDGGHELWKTATTHRVSALGWMPPAGPQLEPMLLVGLASDGGKNVRAFDPKGRLVWENDLGEPVHGPSVLKPFSFGWFDADGDGVTEVVVGNYVRDILLDRRTGERKAVKKTVMFHSHKHLALALPPPTPSWMVTQTYSSPPLCAYTLAGDTKMMNFGSSRECTWPYELVQVGAPVNGVFQVAVAHGPYLSFGRFDTRKGDWIAEGSWQKHLGADVRSLCLIPAEDNQAVDIVCAGDFGFMDRYTTQGQRVGRVPCEWTVHRLVGLSDGNILAGTEEEGLLVLRPEGQVLGRVEGDSAQPVADIRLLPHQSSSSRRFLVLRQNGTLEILTDSRAGQAATTEIRTKKPTVPVDQ